jgi:fructose-specific phosphotransferase system IIC component
MRVTSGIILGYLVFAASAFALFRITGHDPHSPASIRFEIGAIAFGVLFAVLAGFIASFIGGRRDMFAAKCVAVIVAVGAIISMIATVVSWSQIWAVIAMAPAVLLGGWMYRIRAGGR